MDNPNKFLFASDSHKSFIGRKLTLHNVGEINLANTRAKARPEPIQHLIVVLRTGTSTAKFQHQHRLFFHKRQK